jgi:hypothetical protein
MTSFSLIARYAFVVLLALLGTNFAWIVFIVLIDVFCGVRPQLAVALFPAAFIGFILLLMLWARRRAGVSTFEPAGPSLSGLTDSDRASHDPHLSTAGKTILRSMLIVSRKRVSSSASVKGKVL